MTLSTCFESACERRQEPHLERDRDPKSFAGHDAYLADTAQPLAAQKLAQALTKM